MEYRPSALALGLGLVGCSAPESHRIVDTALVDLALGSVGPQVVLPGTTLMVEGDSFVDDPWGTSRLRLQGVIGSDEADEVPLDIRLPASFVDFQHLQVEIDASAFSAFGASDTRFRGLAIVEVESAVDGRLYRSSAAKVALEVHTELAPELTLVQPSGLVFPNEPIIVAGEGLLLGDEGESIAVVSGCFRPRNESECAPVLPQQVSVAPQEPRSRSRGTFSFVPRIAGIEPGHFEGEVILRNVHRSGDVLEVAAQPCNYDLEAPILYSLDTQSASVGQYVGVDGAGFLGAAEGSSELHFVGTFTPDSTGQPIALDETLFPEFVDGQTMHYIINEDDAIGRRFDVRYDTGRFDGTLTPMSAYGDQRVEGDPIPFRLDLEPVKQVVYVDFLPAYKESLRHFGLRAVDRLIRDRALAVVERDFATINVDVRDTVPVDFAVYSWVDVAGPDPNGAGLLGYDNTPGKDTKNLRLYDRIGGVNAQTQQDGYPGYGGVFIESMFGYSEHPGEFTEILNPDPRFDEMIDPFRPDRDGRPVLSEDLALDIPVLEHGGDCPAEPGDRPQQVACAVFVMGNLVGTTLTHELGHSVGLADPFGPDFHNYGDAPDRMMDADRPFSERAEIGGDGPSRFCVEEYEYLRKTLPTRAAPDMTARPPCR